MNNLQQEAITLYNNGNLTAALDKYQQILQQNPTNPNALLNQGVIYLQLDLIQNALNSVLQSLEIDENQFFAHYILALIFERLGNIIDAAQAYQHTITLNPQFIDAYNNLGNILYQDNKIDLAESFYQQAININPQHLGSYINLGNILLAQEKIDDAINIYNKGLEISSDNPDLVNNLQLAQRLKKERRFALLYFGTEYYKQQKYEKAIDKFEKYLKKGIGDENLYLMLGECYINIKDYSQAMFIYQDAKSFFPETSIFHQLLINVLQESGETEISIKLATQYFDLFPDNLYFLWQKHLLLPIIYQTESEINLYRDQFTSGLEYLINYIPLNTSEEVEKAFEIISKHTNFFLGYQGYDDIELQGKYGEFVHKIMSAKYPQWVLPLPRKNTEGRKIKVGYISSFFKNHPGAKWVLGWLQNHNKEQFEIYCYYTNPEQDLTTIEFQKHCDFFYHIPHNLENICQQVINDELDIIVYPDLGMNPQSTLLASLRLAPIQCTGWGHPITSGLPTIDYYLSGELMETLESQKYYTEELILLPKIGLYYPKPQLPEKPRSRVYFGSKTDDIVFVCSQMLSKYLPQYDYIFPEIAKQVPQAKFIFITRPNQYVMNKFDVRLQTAFHKYNLLMGDYCVFMPSLDQVGYMSLNIIGDVFLDTFEWNGGNTTLEAIACNLPIVTCPGKFMRSRHSYGFLQMLEVTETIAENEEEYINIAVKLALDKQFRETIRKNMANNHHLLYNDLSCIKGLENFYLQVL